MRWLVVTGAVVAAGLVTMLLPFGRPPPEAPPAAKAVPAAPGSPPQATPEQVAAAERAGEIVDQALSRRELAPGDVAALRQLGPLLSPSAREELRMKMIQSLNRQELKVDPRAGLP